MNYEDRIRKKDWVVVPVDLLTARYLVGRLHYAKSGSNTACYTHGLFRKGNFLSADCMGVAWWIPPTKSSAMATYPEGDWQKVLSLSRLVVHPDVPKNGCSFLLSRSIKMIDRAKWECLVTYADTYQDHTGTIYRATNWEYMGLTKPQKVYTSRGWLMMGRKRGPVTMTHDQIVAKGFKNNGSFAKHKFRMILNRVNKNQPI
jgi:hypothetical protein